MDAKLAAPTDGPGLPVAVAAEVAVAVTLGVAAAVGTLVAVGRPVAVGAGATVGRAKEELLAAAGAPGPRSPTMSASAAPRAAKTNAKAMSKPSH